MVSKKTIKKSTVIKGILFVAILFLLLLYANRVLIKKECINKYAGFYGEKEDFDILFFGSSRVLDAFQPVQLYEKYGIRSYNMAQHGETLSVDYYQLKNALEYNTPQLVVLDVSMFAGGAVSVDDEQSRSYFHEMVDHMRLSRTKSEAITSNVPREIRAEYYWPFILYHSRWNTVDLDELTLKVHPGDSKGAEVRTNVMPQEKILCDTAALSEVFMPESINLDKIIQLCKDKGVNVLFICMPNNENAQVFSTINHFGPYFEEQKVSYINIWQDEDFLDYSTDFADASHLNNVGAEKITDYIAGVFLETYQPISVGDDTKEEWDQLVK